MGKYSKYNTEGNRRKARWELTLNPNVTMLVVAFCIGVLLIWIGLFEHTVNPGDGTVSSVAGDVCGRIVGFVDSVRK